MDDVGAEIASTTRHAPQLSNPRPIKKTPRSWPLSKKSRQDSEAQDSDLSHSGGDQPLYIRKFRHDISKRQKEVSKKIDELDASKLKGWPEWAKETSKTLQNKYIPRRHRGSDQHKVPFTPKGSITYLSKKPTTVDETDSIRFKPQDLVLGDTIEIRHSLDQAHKKWESEHPPESDDPYQPSAIRWIHLPANNMRWVESVMSSVIATSQAVRDKSYLQDTDYDLMAEHVFQPKVWDNQCREIHHNPIFSRQMEPFATLINVYPEDRINVLVAYMPYLHYESSIAARYMRYVVQDVQSQGLDHDAEAIEKAIETSSRGRDMCQDEVLLRTYLNGGSLHPRRTLDQFHYYDTDNTWKRDYDQAVERYALRGYFNKDMYFKWEPPILMVDQCWVWAIGPDTVLTAFPQIWDCYDQHQDHLDLHKTLLINVKMPLHQHYLDFASEFARFVIRIAAINTLQPSKSFHEHDKFLLYFRRGISSLRQRKTERLNHLWQLLQDPDAKKNLDEIFDVRKEYKMLEEAQDIVEELQMISELLEYQDETMRQFAQAQRRLCKDEGSPDNRSMQRRFKKAEMRKRHSIRARRDLVTGLSQNAEGLNADIQQLLKLKQQQASISEAHLTRKLSEQGSRQEKAILLFAVVTIGFLPLSTMASLFGINSEDLGSGTMALSTIFAIIFPISTICVVVSLLVSLSPAVQEMLASPFKRLWDHIRRRDTEVPSEVSDDLTGFKQENNPSEGLLHATTGSSNISSLLEAGSQRSLNRHRRQKARATISMGLLAPPNSFPEQAMSDSHRKDNRPRARRQRGRFRIRTSKETERTLEPLEEEEVNHYSLSSASDSLNNDSDTAEDEPARFNATLQSMAGPLLRTTRLGKLPM